ncbi:MAG: SCP2 sterol-binding domain-containing protein [Anaerolineae bacterium]
MPFYANADTFYAVIKEVFERMEKDSPRALAALMRSKMIVRFKLTHPLAEILLNGRRAAFQATYGPSKMMADFEAHFTGDTLHKIFLGQWTLAHALNSGQLRINGPIFNALELAELFQAAKTIYPAVLKERGLL